MLALVAVRVMGFQVFPFYDDAYISMRYAENLLEGNGFVFNPGEWVQGITTPLYGLLLVPLLLIPLQIEWVVITVSIAADVGTLLLTYKLFERHGNQSAATLFGLLFIASGVLTRLCASGMESNVYLLTSVFALYLFDQRRAVPAIVVASISYFLRPEAVLLVAALIFVSWLDDRRLSTVIKLGAISLLTVAPGLLLLYFTYGHILPQSVIAKSTVEPWTVWMVAKALMLSDAVCVLMLPFTLYGGYLAVKRNTGHERTIVYWILPFVIAYFIARPAIFKWYGQPVHYAECVLAAAGLAAFLPRFARLGEILFRKTTVAALCATMAIGWGVLAYRAVTVAQPKRLYYQMRDWFIDHPIAGDTMLCGDIGASGYYSDAYIVDPYGLVTPETLKYDSLPQVVAHYKPKYYMAYITPWQIRQMINNPWLLEQYELVERFPQHDTVTTTVSLDLAQYKAQRIEGFFLLRRREITALQ